MQILRQKFEDFQRAQLVRSHWPVNLSSLFQVSRSLWFPDEASMIAATPSALSAIACHWAANCKSLSFTEGDMPGRVCLSDAMFRALAKFFGRRHRRTPGESTRP